MAVLVLIIGYSCADGLTVWVVECCCVAVLMTCVYVYVGVDDCVDISCVDMTG